MEWYYPVLCCLYACILNWPGFQVTNPSVLYLKAKIYFFVENLLYYEEKYKLLFKNVWSDCISSADYKGHWLAACSGFQDVRKAVTLAVLVELNCLFGSSLHLASSECLRVSIELFCVRGCVDTCIPHLERGDALCSWVCSDSEEVEH